MFFVVLCPGTPEGSTGSGSGFKASQKMGQRFSILYVHYSTMYTLFALGIIKNG